MFCCDKAADREHRLAGHLSVLTPHLLEAGIHLTSGKATIPLLPTFCKIYHLESHVLGREFKRSFKYVCKVFNCQTLELLKCA